MLADIVEKIQATLPFLNERAESGVGYSMDACIEISHIDNSIKYEALLHRKSRSSQIKDPRGGTIYTKSEMVNPSAYRCIQEVLKDLEEEHNIVNESTANGLCLTMARAPKEVLEAEIIKLRIIGRKYGSKEVYEF
ncbi:hypothetical protein KW787_01150 [Candidatus Pacearchaeota archaeon]|nr:hypothetical protein [Candidatus Pacearchaeota archaeon]